MVDWMKGINFFKLFPFDAIVRPAPGYKGLCGVPRAPGASPAAQEAPRRAPSGHAGAQGLSSPAGGSGSFTPLNPPTCL